MDDRNGCEDKFSADDDQFVPEEMDMKWWELFCKIADGQFDRGIILNSAVFSHGINKYFQKRWPREDDSSDENQRVKKYSVEMYLDELVALEKRVRKDKKKFYWEQFVEDNELEPDAVKLLLWVVYLINKRAMSEESETSEISIFGFGMPFKEPPSFTLGAITDKVSIPREKVIRSLLELSGKSIITKVYKSPIPNQVSCSYYLNMRIIDFLFPYTMNKDNNDNKQMTGFSDSEGSLDIERPTISFNDVILTDFTRSQFENAIAQIKHKDVLMNNWGLNQVIKYGKGVIIFISGPPGTGKTMSAKALANAVDKPFHLVDYSKLVSKWVGDTGKNIRHLFRQAQNKDVILFFDEADSVVSKRTTVSCSTDKGSNRDVNILLQEIENYEGVLVLASNMIEQIDCALSRRVNLFIKFEQPDKKARYLIWEKHLPPSAPLDDDISIDKLAKPPLSGGEIKNAVLFGFRRAACRLDRQDIDSITITMKDLYEGIDHELHARNALREITFSGRSKEHWEVA